MGGVRFNPARTISQTSTGAANFQAIFSFVPARGVR